ncbi:MAG: hypothetical protein U1E23_12420 [Reyranellaceae bacterium]
MAGRSAVVWIDISEARVFAIEGDGPSGPPQHHHRHESGRVRDDREFFEAVLASLETADAWLLAGPDHTRHDLEKYLDGHAEALRGKLAGVEAMAEASPDALKEATRRLATWPLSARPAAPAPAGRRP